MDINLEIQYAFLATQILLVFITVLFSIRYPEINALLNEDSSDEYVLGDLEIKISQTLKNSCGVLLTITLVVGVIFLPLMYQVFRGFLIYLITQSISLNDYNLVQTSFFLISVMIWGFLCWSIILTKKLYNHLKKIRKKIAVIEKQESEA